MRLLASPCFKYTMKDLQAIKVLPTQLLANRAHSSILQPGSVNHM